MFVLTKLSHIRRDKIDGINSLKLYSDCLLSYIKSAVHVSGKIQFIQFDLSKTTVRYSTDVQRESCCVYFIETLKGCAASKNDVNSQKQQSAKVTRTTNFKVNLNE